LSGSGGYRGDGLCGDFLKGSCLYGASCRFVHPRGLAPALTSCSAGDSLRSDGVHGAPRLPAAGGGFRGDGICGDFVRGTCMRGANCRFVHGAVGEVKPPAAAYALGFRGDGMCGDFLRGSCKYGDSCKYSHGAVGNQLQDLCIDFQQGNCTLGDACLFRHDTAQLQMAKSPDARLTLGGFRGDGVCGDFRLGRCTRGADCRFAHITVGEVSLAADAPLAPFRGDGNCGDFLRGVCVRGADCRFAHPTTMPALPPASLASMGAPLAPAATPEPQVAPESFNTLVAPGLSEPVVPVPNLGALDGLVQAESSLSMAPGGVEMAKLTQQVATLPQNPSSVGLALASAEGGGKAGAGSADAAAGSAVASTGTAGAGTGSACSDAEAGAG